MPILLKLKLPISADAKLLLTPHMEACGRVTELT